MSGKNEGQGAKPNKARGESQSAAPSPPIVRNDDVEEAEDRADHGRKGGKERPWLPQGIKPAEWIMIAFTAVTAMAAWAGVVVSNGQLASMKEAGEQTQRAIEESHRLADLAADANGVAVYARNTAKASADAALESAQRDGRAALQRATQANEISRDAARAADRAWIGVSGMIIDNGNSGQLIAAITFANSGHEPALGLVHYIDTSATVLTDNQMKDLRNVSGGINSTCDGLQPKAGGEAVYPNEPQSTTIVLNWLQKIPPKAVLFIKGCFAYLTEGRPHYTAVCEFTNPTMIDAAVAGRAFYYCADGNRAD